MTDVTDMEYDIKRGHFKNLDDAGLKDLIGDIFGNVNEKGDTLVASYGAMKELRVRIIDKGTISVETVSNPDVSNEVALDTIRRFNRFLESATGLNSKQRKDRLNKKAKAGKL